VYQLVTGKLRPETRANPYKKAMATFVFLSGKLMFVLPLKIVEGKASINTFNLILNQTYAEDREDYSQTDSN